MTKTTAKYGWLTPTQAAEAVPGTSYSFWRRVRDQGRVPYIRLTGKTLINVDAALECLTIQPTTNTTMREREAG